MKCRGQINVKGKGSMVTYFLQRPTTADGTDGVLTHQNSKMTAASSEDYELCGDIGSGEGGSVAAAIDDDGAAAAAVAEASVDDMNSDSARLTQKRKSLCRQHNIFSSLTNKSIGSSNVSDAMGGSLDANDEIVMPTEKTKLLTKSDSQASAVIGGGSSGGGVAGVGGDCGSGTTILSPEIYPRKYDFKPNLPQHCVTLKDSIESLEKLLKNDYSLSDLSTNKVITTTKVAIENGDIPSTMNPLNPKVFITPQPQSNRSSNGKIKSNGLPNMAATTSSFNHNVLIAMPSLSTSSSSSTATTTTTSNAIKMDDQIKRTIKRTITFGDRSLMKISKSLYSVSKERIDTFKIPNSKSMCVISSQNQNGSVSLI